MEEEGGEEEQEEAPRLLECGNHCEEVGSNHFVAP